MFNDAKWSHATDITNIDQVNHYFFTVTGHGHSSGVAIKRGSNVALISDINCDHAGQPPD